MTDAGTTARHAGAEAAHSTTLRRLITVGLCAYGLVHLLIGWLALQIAFGTGGSGEADQQGALATLAGQPFGAVLLWATAVGLFALVLWQGLEAAIGHQNVDEDRKRLVRRVGSAARAVVYAALGYAAVRTVTGSGSSGGDQKQEGLTAQLLGLGFGRFLVGGVGVVVLVVAGRQIWRGVKKKFTRDLDGGVAHWVIRLGQIGYVARGVALAVIGGLFIWAAVTYDPEKAGGLDDALRTVHDAPLGSVLLAVLALGVLAFGVFCFVWARHPRVTASRNPAGRDSASQ